MSRAQLLRLGVAALARGIRSGEVAPADYLDALAAWIDETQPQLNTFVARSLETARRQLRTLPDDGLLRGVPLAIKDLLHVEGFETTCGSRLLAGYRPPFEATAVTRLRAAGAVPFGKLNLDEFAMGSSNETSALGPVRNPWAREHIPGGSSGGCAAAVAALQTPGTLGSDTGGSIRQPAALCGITGLKPTYGRVSRYGLVAFASSLDQIGPMARSAEDCALLLAAIAGHDPRDATSARNAPLSPEALLAPVSESLTIGLPREYLETEGIDTQVREAVEQVEAWARDAGHTLKPVTLPHTQYSTAVYYLIATAEASSNLSRFDGLRYGNRVEAGDLLSTYAETRGAGFGTEVKRRIMLGTFALSSGYYEAYYGKAQKARTKIREDFDTVFQDVDVLLTPTSPTPAFRLGERIDDPLAMYLSDVFTNAANLAGIPAISFPCGFATSADGASRLPVGAQLMAPAVAGPCVPTGHGKPFGDPSRVRRGRRAAMSGWETVIGLEVHVQLATSSKIFCGCPNRFGDSPNTNICPVCTGQPGVLPVLNDQAVCFAVLTALATDCTIYPQSSFARKQYFYPDLPKGYQISQYEAPYAENGQLLIEVDGQHKTIGITRIHMEEDAGKNVHDHGRSGESHVDFNRAGAPLIEIVSEPDMRTPAEAGAYMRALHTLVRAIGVSDADLEKGNFRCDANVSVRREGSSVLGTKTELKNLNSFRFIERAITYEAQRQIAVLDSGEQIVQETRLYDSDRNRTYAMRSKEEAHDYRYFPDPDLPPLVIESQAIEQLRSALPELPQARKQRYRDELGFRRCGYIERGFCVVKLLRHGVERRQ